MFKYFVVFQMSYKQAFRMCNAEMILTRHIQSIEDVEELERRIKNDVCQEYPDAIITVINWRKF